MSAGIPITQAAKILRRHPATIRRWIRQGCPAVQLGEVGRDGSRVDLDAVMHWRASQAVPALRRTEQEAVLALVAATLWETFRYDRPHERVGISEAQAAGAYALVFERLHRILLKEPTDLKRLPKAIEQLCSIWISSGEQVRRDRS